MGTQPSSRRDLFGTEGLGEEDNDSDIGTRGHSSQGGTAGTKTGGTKGHDAGAQGRTGNPVNKQGVNTQNTQGPGEERITKKE